MKLSLFRLGWKVPLRAVYCETFSEWLKSTIWCHFVIRVFPHAVDLGTDPFVADYIETPKMFFEQYAGHLIRTAIAKPSRAAVRPEEQPPTLRS